ncbi:MAG: hypothetical protein ACSLEN_03930 [Candidatus Malihini olakiniferum]
MIGSKTVAGMERAPSCGDIEWTGYILSEYVFIGNTRTAKVHHRDDLKSCLGVWMLR